MKNNTENPVRDFLMSRRAQVQPESVGLPRGRRRRVSGLRREEAASLAGISVEYYTQIERGDVSRVSDDVLKAVADAMLLDPVETSYLLSLAHGIRHPQQPEPPTVPGEVLPSAMRSIIEGMPEVAVLVLSNSLDILDFNPPGKTLHSLVFAGRQEHLNLATFLFESPYAQELFPDWPLVADECVAMLRLATSRSSGSRRVHDVVDRISANSGMFAERWQRHDVAQHYAGVKRFNHPQVGQMTLQFQALTAPGILDPTLYCYTPVPEDDQSIQSFERLLALSYEEA